ncbi:hypothetical protein HMPREF0758_3520 [Serratia odorifera DSM 4582]|uniref:Uncharacterized protein n=1 Tax=Serratia odorifera DSM 4582 TaxID=667129 RepID=D4E5S0_SEROD|nr:hypothetical protein HMPREF0758_3520 [Serratia odorifera DSM 4582]
MSIYSANALFCGINSTLQPIKSHERYFSAFNSRIFALYPRL